MSAQLAGGFFTTVTLLTSPFLPVRLAQSSNPPFASRSFAVDFALNSAVARVQAIVAPGVVSASL